MPDLAPVTGMTAAQNSAAVDAVTNAGTAPQC